jgi:MG2 domain.
MSLNKLTAILMVMLLVSPSLVMAEEATGLTVFTDEPAYEPGEEVEISGTAEPNSEVNITVSDGSDEIFNDTVYADGEGEFLTEFTLPEEVAAGVYTVIALVFEVTAEMPFTVVEMDLKELAEGLLDKAKELKEDLDEILELLEDDEIDLPEDILDVFEEAMTTLEEAEQLVEEEKYGSAAEKAREALGVLGSVFDGVQALVPEEEPPEYEEPEDDVKRGISLYVAIDMALRYVDKVNETVDRLIDEEYEFDMEGIRKSLKDAEEALLTLREDLDSLDSDTNIADIVQELARIRESLGEMNELLQSTVMKRYKVEMTERFMEQIQNQVRVLNETILKLRERLEAEKTVIVGNALWNVYRTIERLRERLLTDDVDELLDELEDTVEDIDENLDELNGKGASTNLKSMNVVEARINVLRKSAERLRRKGRDTSDVDKELEATKGLLERMMEQLQKGNSTATRNILDEVKEKYEELRGNVESPILNQIKEKFLDQIQKKLQDYTTKISP